MIFAIILHFYERLCVTILHFYECLLVLLPLFQERLDSHPLVIHYVKKIILRDNPQDDFLCLNQRLIDLRSFFLMQPFTLSTVALNGLVITETSHRMTPVFVLNALQFGVFLAAKFAFLTPETDVEDKSFGVFEHNFNDVLINGDADKSA